ncbi:site-specific integrase [Lactiplantibacillus plantarum]|uniref:tyrosine-type recombinase/integrase n=1 Tax=Lactiplantibacillus plantarum TaxID=1590 RepID=UPI000FEC2EE3|nr:site-specific integrase [Lactiplantibacillus plantarum]QAB23406.1 site-specific integrase [Lactiplantibacillus plantarum]
MRGSIRRRGNRWYYAYEGPTIDGKRQRIEHVGGRTREEAERALRKAIDEFERGGVVIKLTEMSVADYFDYWHENFVVKTLKYNTQTNYRNIINNYIKPDIGMYRMKSIGPASIQKFVNDLPTDKLSKHTIEIIVSVLRKGFKMAVFPYQLIKENPANYIVKPTNNNDDEITQQAARDKLKIINMGQFKQILALVPESNPLYLPLIISFNTGLRRGEVSGLTWDNIDFDNKTLTVNKQMIMKKKEFDVTSPKTKASYRTIAVGNSLLTVLKRFRTYQKENKVRYGQFYFDSPFVCTKQNGKPITPSVIKYYTTKLSRELDFPFNFHSLRHTHATMLLENGAKYKEIQQRLGHSRISTTLDTYSHVTNKMKRDTVDIFENMLKNNS